MAEVSLHSDTISFLSQRKTWRDALANAFAGDPESSPVSSSPTLVELEADVEEAIIEVQEAEAGADPVALASAQADLLVAESALAVATADAVCSPTAGGCVTINNKFNNLPASDAPELTTDLWPLCASLYNQLLQRLANSESAKLTITEQRQINILESYRRMLLHKKQRKCHLLAAYTAQMDNEPQSQDELQRLLLNQQVGREVVDYPTISDSS